MNQEICKILMSVHILYFSEMSCPFDYQCDDCGRRFPRHEQLTRHRRISHSTNTVACRWCPYTKSVSQAYRVRDHEKIHRKYLDFVPSPTPQHTGMKSTVTSYRPEPVGYNNVWDTPTTRELTQTLDEAMPDFADLLSMEPRTPSPLKTLRNEQPPPKEVTIPSDQLFVKYLTETEDKEKTSTIPSPPNTSNQLLDLHVTTSSIPSPPNTTNQLLDLTISSISSPPNTINDLLDLTTSVPSSPQLLDLSTSAKPITPKEKVPPTVNNSSPVNHSPSTSTQLEPLDLSTKPNHSVKSIPLEPTIEIDCRKPLNSWTPPKPITTKYQPSKLYEHKCVDPRFFFAGAPSSYLSHPLAKTLQEKVNMSRSSCKSNYERRLTPVGVHMIIKEERCTLKDGTLLELRDTWICTKDTIQEE